jgi:hypothetical protein
LCLSCVPNTLNSCIVKKSTLQIEKKLYLVRRILQFNSMKSIGLFDV